jgi:hypothetical protein
VRLIEKVVTEQVAHSGTECLHTVLYSARRWDGVIEGLVSMLATSPIPALRPYWFEIEDYVKRLTHALDRAESRTQEYVREHPDWQG